MARTDWDWELGTGAGTVRAFCCVEFPSIIALREKAILGGIEAIYIHAPCTMQMRVFDSSLSSVLDLLSQHIYTPGQRLNTYLNYIPD